MQKPPPIIFSPARNAAKWARAKYRFLSNSGEQPFLLAGMIEDVAERLQFMRVDPGSALIIGDWAGDCARFLESAGWQTNSIALGDLDEEVPLPSWGYDLIIHLMGLGHVNDLPGSLLHLRAALADGGLFFASFPGAGSLTAMRKIALAADGERPAPRCHPLVDNQAAAALLQRAGFKKQVVDSHTISARYQTLDKLVSDLRDHGLTGSLKSTAPAFTKQRLRLAQEQFEGLKDQQGKTTETFEILTLTGWK